MSEPETTSKQDPTEASDGEAYESADQDASDAGVETPMLAVWLSLGVILLAGLYGVYLGTSSKSKSTSSASPATSLLVPSHGPGCRHTLGLTVDGRHS